MSIVLGSNNTSIVRRSVPGIILHIIDLYSPVPQGYTFQSNVEQDNTRVKFSANAKREESWKKNTINHQLNTQKPHREQRKAAKYGKISRKLNSEFCSVTPTGWAPTASYSPTNNHSPEVRRLTLHPTPTKIPWGHSILYWRGCAPGPDNPYPWLEEFWWEVSLFKQIMV